MKKQNLIAILGLFALFIVAFSSGRVIAPADAQGVVGSVYIMSNSASGNQVIVYSRAADGTLTWNANYATNGLGINGLTGSNQGGMVLSEDGRWLIVVNAGSNDISVFSVNHKGLTLTDRTSSQGTMPISATVHGNVVYVLNSGGAESTGNIAGFALSDGQLSELSGSVQPLSGVAAPAEISFNPTGTALVVTEKSTSKIDTFLVNSEGVASTPNVQSSSGGTPFGFDFTPSGTLIVSEAAGGPTGTSAVSSYTISDSGSLTTLSASIPDTQQAACWLIVTGNGQFAYTANAHSTTISSYTIAGNGKISTWLSQGTAGSSTYSITATTLS